MALASFGARASGLRLERMKSSAHYADGTFCDTAPVSPGLKKGTAAPRVTPWWRAPPARRDRLARAPRGGMRGGSAP